MTLRVHASKWKDPEVRRRILAYARERAVESGRPSFIRVRDRWFIQTKVTIWPW